MKTALLLTGRPGVGKTSLIREAVAPLSSRAGGFYTQETREQGRRTGFEIITLAGRRAPLAHVAHPGPYRVSRYGVDLPSLEAVAVPALREAIASKELIVVDEIGKMELASERFRGVLLEALSCGKPLLGTILLGPHPWADRVKALPQVSLVTVTEENRAQVVPLIQQWLAAMGLIKL